MKNPVLKYGLPNRTGGASYSRFVLPFAYDLTVSTDKESEFVFNELKDKDEDLDARKKYLTSETDAVIFTRAKWFRLEDESGSPFSPSFVLNHRRKKLKLRVENVRLVLFESRAKYGAPWDLLQNGFLILDLYFDAPEKGRSLRNPPTLDDLLYVNEMFRFFDPPYPEHRDQMVGFFPMESVDALTRVASRKSDKSSNDTGESSQKRYDWWWKLLEFPVERNRCLLVCKDDAKQRSVYPDNRAFVWTAALLAGGAKALWPEIGDLKESDHWNADRYLEWINLLNVDRPETGNPTDFERDWAKERTYHRWEQFGTYYGFTTHSGAMLGDPPSYSPTHLHFREMYFDQMLLLLYVRTTLFRFSEKLSSITSAERMQPDGQEEWLKEFRDLYRQFTEFTNMYRFPLLSNQQQALEMYALARKSTDIDELFREVQEQIRASYEFVNQEEAARLGDSAERLSVVAAIGVVVTIIVGFLAVPDVFDSIYRFLANLLQLPANTATPRPLLNWRLGVAFVIIVSLGSLFGYSALRLLRRYAAHLKRFLRKRNE
ncbi:MAG: hypothetical protein IPN69_01720 [Acidobacteria bacterium]|nr:hypothetical protein [Acidobacteriota bacterium]